ncbi:MAG: hypothetical protein Q9207_001233 [Kuettlingeria erythrocarpa]
MPLIVTKVRVPPLASLYQEDPRLPNTGADYTRIGGPRRYKWSPEEKQILYILSRYFKNEAVDLWKVFLAFFAKRYRISTRPRKSAWNTMRVWNLNSERYSVWWGAITTTRLKAKLEQQAARIGIRLQLVLRGDPKSRPSRKRKLSRSSGSTSNSDGGWDTENTEAADHQSRQTGVLRTYQDNPQTPRQQRFRTAQTSRPIPSIAFRAFGSNSQGVNGINGFVAGSFVGTEQARIPSPPGQAAYLHDLERHLATDHSGATPFISTPWPFYTDIIKHSTNTKGVRKAMASAVRRSLNYADGLAIGAVLSQLGIPKRYLQDLCTTILADWRYFECEGQAWLANEEFVQGLTQSYREAAVDFVTMAADDVEIAAEGFHESGVARKDNHKHSPWEPNNEDRKSHVGLKNKEANPPGVEEGFERFLADVEEAAFRQ